MTISPKSKLATLSVVTFILTTSATLAAPAIATGGVNVRTGPSTQYAKVDTLHKGETVDVKQCQSGWCYVQHNGPNGWVSANYLTNKNYKKQQPKKQNNQQPEVNFGFGFSDGDMSFGFGIGTGGDVKLPKKKTNKQKSKVACIYSNKNFQGEKKCYSSGQIKGQLTGFWNDNIASVKVQPGSKISLCSNLELNGKCRTYKQSKKNLPAAIKNKASSLAVY